MGWLWVAPSFLDPVLALVEMIDRRVRRLRPIRSEGLLAIERRQHRGAPVELADGTRISSGDEAWVIHFDNQRVRRLARHGWQTAGYRLARADLEALAVQHRALPAERRPVAYTGVTMLAPLTRRLGFELRPASGGFFGALRDWYLRSLLARWSIEGRARLRAGRHPLRSQVCWLSERELLRRFS